MNYFKEYEKRKEIHLDLAGNESRYNSKGYLIYRKYPDGLEIWFDGTSGDLYRARFQNGTECFFNENGTIKIVTTPISQKPIIIHE